MNERQEVTVLFERSSEVVFFILLILLYCDIPGPVEETPDSCPLCTSWMVRVEVQVSVRVRLLPVDSYVKSLTFPSCKFGVEEEREPSFSNSMVNLMVGHTLRW